MTSILPGTPPKERSVFLISGQSMPCDSANAAAAAAFSKLKSLESQSPIFSRPPFNSFSIKFSRLKYLTSPEPFAAETKYWLYGSPSFTKNNFDGLLELRATRSNKLTFAWRYFSKEPWASMCSGRRLVYITALKFINLWRCCRIPCEVTSISAYSHPALTAFRKNRCIKNRPGMVIEVAFFSTDLSILNRTEDKSAVFFPAVSKIALISSSVVDFPFVPVTPNTNNFWDGKPYTIFPSQAKQK